MSKMISKAVLLLAWIVSATGVVAQEEDARQKIDQAVRFANERNYDLSEHLLLEVLDADAQEVSLESPDRMRRSFVAKYFESRDRLRRSLALCPDYPNVPFDFRRSVIEAGHGEAYDYWVLRFGDPAKFDARHASHRRQWKAFAEWFAAHPLHLDDGHRFDRMQYGQAGFKEN